MEHRRKNYGAWLNTTTAFEKRGTFELHLNEEEMAKYIGKNKGRVRGQSYTLCERLPSVQPPGKWLKTWFRSQGYCWDVQGFVKPCWKFAGLLLRNWGDSQGRCGTNLLHYAVISVRLLQKLTVACVLILFKRKYKNKCSKVKYKCLLGITVS